MPITTADNKKQVVIPTARPGDVFEIRQQSGERVVLVRLVKPEPKPRLSRAEALRAIASRPLCPKMNWSELRRITREP
jgi:hypothetical protein